MPQKRLLRGIKNFRNELFLRMLDDKANMPEAYADRIAREYGNDWHSAYDTYWQDPEFWENAYENDPVHSRVGPETVPVKRTSRLPAVPANDPSTGGGFWDGLFPGRSSLREAQGRWRE